jgi:hypothetical protein
MMVGEYYVAARWIGDGKHTGVAFDDLAVGKPPNQTPAERYTFQVLPSSR